MSLYEGMQLQNGRYIVERPLGQGGMGAAHLVQDTKLLRSCVIKELRLHDTSNQAQFEKEAQMLASLQPHPHLPVIYDYFLDGRSPYIVMQYIEGTTVNRLQPDRSQPFEVHDVLKWARDLLTAVQYLHEQRVPIIHRDIKPHNVCITPDGKAVLLDLGIARRLDEGHTQTAAQAVTSGFAPIEQYPETQLLSMRQVHEYVTRLHAADIRTGPYSDIYGLGATLYYMLTLLTPTDACLRILGETIPPIQERNPDVPDFLATAIARALEVDPRQRFQSATEMQAALQPESVAVIVSEEDKPAISPATMSDLPFTDIEILGQKLIYISEGEFLMGSNDHELKESCRPQHRVKVGPFCIGQRPITNADYQRFIADNPEYQVPYNPLRFAQRYNWDRRARTFPRGLEHHPVVLVTWQDALAYCDWLTQVSGYACRLPSEAEWEKAAAWDTAVDQARLYPWGDTFDPSRCNVDDHGDLRLEATPAGYYSPAGDSPYGLQDAAGNVWEWTASLYQPYPYVPDNGREDVTAVGERVIRGGAFDEVPLLARCAWRHGVKPDLTAANIGFRIACDAA